MTTIVPRRAGMRLPAWRIDAVPPHLTASVPVAVFDGLRAALAGNRAQFYLDFAGGPFYGFNRPGAQVSDGLIRNWWRQAMMGSIQAQYECVKALSETDFTADLMAIELPVLVIHSKDDQIVPYDGSGPLSAGLLRNGILKTFEDLPHGLCATHAELVNPVLLAFVRGETAEADGLIVARPVMA